MIFLPGRRYRVFFGKMVHGDSSSLVFWEIRKGVSLRNIKHVHEQITYIVEGELGDDHRGGKVPYDGRGAYM